MSACARYRYAEATDGDGRAQYHFAPFEGSAFLEAYRASRAALIAACRDGLSQHDRGGASQAIADDAIDRMRREFETRGCFAEANGAESVSAAVSLWAALAQRCAARADVRDVNCMLKLGDWISRIGVDRLRAGDRPLVAAAAIEELRRVAELEKLAGAQRSVCANRPLALSAVRRRAVHARTFGMLLVNSSRSRAYVDVLARCDLLPANVVYVSRGSDDDERGGPAVDGFDNETPVLARLRELNVETRRVETVDINHASVVRAVADAGAELMVYSGFAGAKVKGDLLRAGVELLHVHGGRVPAQRGSTTCYYSLLEAGCCWASAILLDAKLDRGAVVAQRRYAPPSDRAQIDHGFDAVIRADLLARVLSRYVEHGMLPRLPQPMAGTMHYVMHPVLRHVAILAGSSGATAGAATAPSPATAWQRSEPATVELTS